MKKVGPGTLKCVISDTSVEPVLAALREHVATDDIREASETACLVHTELETSELRDILSRAVGEGESLLVLEFEKWSGFGPGVDRDWLMARGH